MKGGASEAAMRMVREGAARLVFEHRGEYGSQWVSDVSARQSHGAHPVGAGREEGDLPGSRSRLRRRCGEPSEDAGRPRQGVRANGQ